MDPFFLEDSISVIFGIFVVAFFFFLFFFFFVFFFFFFFFPIILGAFGCDALVYLLDNIFI